MRANSYPDSKYLRVNTRRLDVEQEPIELKLDHKDWTDEVRSLLLRSVPLSDGVGTVGIQWSSMLIVVHGEAACLSSTGPVRGVQQTAVETPCTVCHPFGPLRY